MNKDSVLLPHLVALVIMMIWSETFVSSKIVLDAGLRSVDLFSFRFILAYFSIWLISHNRLWADSWKDEFILFILGVTGGSLYFVLENEALAHSMAGNVAILVGSCPLYTAFLASLFYKEEKVGARQYVGSVMALVGMVLVVFNGQVRLHLNPLGDALAIGAAWAWAVYSLFLKRVVEKYDSFFISRKVFGYGALSVLPYFYFYPMTVDLEFLLQPKVLGNVLYLGIIASMLCFVFWNWVLGKLGTVRATNYVYVQSLFTLLWAFLLLGERVTIMAVMGAIILISGMVLALKR